MCGIIGFVRASAHGNMANATRFMETGLYVDTLRGSCGTGLFTVDEKSREVNTFKRALAGPDFLNSMQWDMAEKDLFNQRIVVGHNRASTIGGAKDKNCHPFHFFGEKNEIVLVHNGTINNHFSLTDKWRKDFTHEVDSAHIAYSMAQRGELETLEMLKGAFVLVWYNKTEETFNIARNHMRDISWILDKKGNMLFASEWLMLDFVMDRADIETCREFEEIEEMTWQKWDMSSATADLSKFETIKIVEKKEESFRGHAGSFYDTRERVSGYLPWSGYEADDDDVRWQWKTPPANFPYKVGETIYAQLISYEPLTKKTDKMFAGRVEGYDIREPHADIILRHVREDDWNLYKDWTIVPINVNGLGMAGKCPVVYGNLSWQLLKSWEKDGLPDKIKVMAEEIKKESNRFVPGPAGVLIPLDKWRDYVRTGCAICTDPIGEYEFSNLHWANGAEPPAVLCHSCSKDKIAKEFLDAGGTMVKLPAKEEKKEVH